MSVYTTFVGKILVIRQPAVTYEPQSRLPVVGCTPPGKPTGRERHRKAREMGRVGTYPALGVGNGGAGDGGGEGVGAEGTNIGIVPVQSSTLEGTIVELLLLRAQEVWSASV
jgi:hypothetical protein